MQEMEEGITQTMTVSLYEENRRAFVKKFIYFLKTKRYLRRETRQGYGVFFQQFTNTIRISS